MESDIATIMILCIRSAMMLLIAQKIWDEDEEFIDDDDSWINGDFLDDEDFYDTNDTPI